MAGHHPTKMLYLNPSPSSAFYLLFFSFSLPSSFYLILSINSRLIDYSVRLTMSCAVESKNGSFVMGSLGSR